VFILPDKSVKVSNLNSFGFGSSEVTNGLANKNKNNKPDRNLKMINFQPTPGRVEDNIARP
jgi:hypothetical protein